MTAIGDILGPWRVPFLLLTPACVLVGVGTAMRAGAEPGATAVALLMIGALAAHVSVNTFNEYLDYRSGLDARTERTPFSGGSGTLLREPSLATATLIVACASLCTAGAVGLLFARRAGAAVVLFGVAGVALVLTYTPWIVRHPLACLFAPGLGFGPVMVMGTHAALTGAVSLAAFGASLPVLFLVSNLLLLNQFPDVAADRGVGRRHLPIVIGRRRSAYVFVTMLVAAYVALLAAVARSALPQWSLLGMLTVPLGLLAAIGVLRHAEQTGRLHSAMTLNVVVSLGTPALVAAGLFVDGARP